jgi:hypothetical protein
MYFIVKNNTCLTKMQRKIIEEAMNEGFEISFSDASYSIEDNHTKITIHEEEEPSEVV